jgi:hypothetical protein
MICQYFTIVNSSIDDNKLSHFTIVFSHFIVCQSFVVTVLSHFTKLLSHCEDSISHSLGVGMQDRRCLVGLRRGRGFAHLDASDSVD